MAVGIAMVATALGTSTMPERRPSQGQEERRRNGALAMLKSTDLMSMAESLSAMLPPDQSIISTRNNSPSVTSATAGM
ncbi:hypothetical protein IEQ34_016059 [Dendrobium chrysotoxum]|uniref:Uncharacterized protein n=1 Tax=Dendrobium chrysotoxum TaxID=161865 RepID=A0AAV7GD36_DENCH|nr:hypothetical protein IEQ34_016059 [Dendrobium chrysotoxum]